MSWKDVHATTLAAITSLILGAAVLAVPAPGHAQGDGRFQAGQVGGFEPGHFGLGLGKATLASGLTAKSYLTNSSAIQAHLGYTNGWG